MYQSHGYKGSWLGQRAKAFGIPWQAVFHGFTWENPLVRLYHALDVRWLRHADEVIAVSRPFEQTLLTKGISPARLRWNSQRHLRTGPGSNRLGRRFALTVARRG